MNADRIDAFSGDYRWLSNFARCEIEFEGIAFSTVEHAYQAAKSLDLEKRREIAALPTPGKAKRVGKKIEPRSGWEEIKIGIMEQLLRQKFSNPELATKLARTGTTELIEGNPWGDVFWGVCNGVGENWLGRLLMRVREEVIAAGNENR